MKDKKSVSFYEDVLSEEVLKKCANNKYVVSETNGQFKITFSYADMSDRDNAVKDKARRLTETEKDEMLEKLVWIRLQDDIRKDMRYSVGLAESTATLTRAESKIVASDKELQESIKQLIAEKKAQSK